MIEQKDDAAPDAKSASSGTVALAIDYGNGAQKRFTSIPLSEGAGVVEVLRAAGAIKPGLEFEFNVTLASDRAGSERGFIGSIDGVSGSQSNQQWMIWINDQCAGHDVSTVSLLPARPNVNTGDIITLKLVAGK